MYGSSRRFWLLASLIPVLAVVYLLAYGLPGSGGSTGTDDGVRAQRGQGNAPAPAEGGAKPANQSARTGYREVARLSHRRDPEDLPELRRAAVDTSWKKRHAAVTGIGRLKDKGDPKLLVRVLANTSERPEVRAAAAEGLGEMRHADAGPVLIQAMEDRSKVVRAAAGIALWKIMRVRYGFRAGDSLRNRQTAIQLIRQEWPKFYAFVKNHKG